MTKYVFKASELPALERHPSMWAFTREAGTQMRCDSDYMALGRAYHKAMELAATAGRDGVADDALARIARDEKIAFGDLKSLWAKLAWDPKGYSAEVPLMMSRSYGDDEIEIHMVTDLCRFVGQDVVEAVEMKTGDPSKAIDAADHAQLLANLCALRRNFGRPIGIGYMLYAAKGDRGWSDCEIRGDEEWERVENFVYGICERAIDNSRRIAADRACRIGEGCGYCAGRHLCPAYMKPAKDHYEMVVAGKPFEITVDTVERAFHLRRMLEAAVNKLKDGTKAFVEANGPVALSDGRVMKSLDAGRTENLDHKHVRAALRARNVPEDQIKTLIEEIDRERGRSEWTEVRIVGSKRKGGEE